MIWLDHYFSTQVRSITSRRHRLNPALSGWLCQGGSGSDRCFTHSVIAWALCYMELAPSGNVKCSLNHFKLQWIMNVKTFKSTHKDHVTKQCNLFEANPDPILQIYPEPNRETLKQGNSGEDWNKLRCLSRSSDCTNTNKQTRTSTLNRGPPIKLDCQKLNNISLKNKLLSCVLVKINNHYGTFLLFSGNYSN